MGIWGDKLEVNVVLAEGFLHVIGSLVVKDVESGSCTVLLEVFMARIPGFSNIQGLPVPAKLVVDGVGFIVEEDKDVLVST